MTKALSRIIIFIYKNWEERTRNIWKNQTTTKRYIMNVLSSNRSGIIVSFEGECIPTLLFFFSREFSLANRCSTRIHLDAMRFSSRSVSHLLPQSPEESIGEGVGWQLNLRKNTGPSRSFFFFFFLHGSQHFRLSIKEALWTLRVIKAREHELYSTWHNMVWIAKENFGHVKTIMWMIQTFRKPNTLLIMHGGFKIRWHPCVGGGIQSVLTT